jgi:hypothetical protein
MIKSAEDWQVRQFNRVLESYTCIINGSFFRSFGVWDLTTKSVEEENRRPKKKNKEETADVCAWVLESKTQAITYAGCFIRTELV